MVDQKRIEMLVERAKIARNFKAGSLARAVDTEVQRGLEDVGEALADTLLALEIIERELTANGSTGMEWTIVGIKFGADKPFQLIVSTKYDYDTFSIDYNTSNFTPKTLQKLREDAKSDSLHLIRGIVSDLVFRRLSEHVEAATKPQTSRDF